MDLVQKLPDSSYQEVVIKTIKQFKSNFDRDTLKKNLQIMDSVVPEPFNDYLIPYDRKELIFKMITLRFEKLVSLI